MLPPICYQWLFKCSLSGAGGTGPAEGNVKEISTAFLQDDQGQDLIEYTLLLAFVCLATAALFISSGGSLSGIWTTANSQLTVANAASAS